MIIEQSNKNGRAGDAGERASQPAKTVRAAKSRGFITLLHVAAALVFVAAVTGGLLLMPATIPADLISIIYLIPVVLAGTRSGLVPALAAALAGGAAADFFFFTPYYTLYIDNPPQILELLLFLAVALICSNLAARVRYEADISRRREAQIAALYDFSRQLARCFTVNDLLGATQRYLSRELGNPAVFFVSPDDDGYRQRDPAGIPDGVWPDIHSLAHQGDAQAKAIVDRETGGQWLLKPVFWNGTSHGVIAVDLGLEAKSSVDQDLRQIEAAIAEVALTLSRIDIGNAMSEARSRWQEGLLRDAMHGIVSHELRTPLASIVGAASVLQEKPALRADQSANSLIEGIHEEATQLDGFLENLITASRLTADGVKPRKEWTDPADIVNAALARRSRRLFRHAVETTFATDLPLVEVDQVLIEEALGQLLDNAAKYSAAGSRVQVGAGMDSGEIVLSVTDEGMGLIPEEMSQLGRKSFRGQRRRNTTPGFGLGLWITSAFVQANGGRFKIASRDDGPGTAASIILPAGTLAHHDEEAVAHD